VCIRDAYFPYNIEAIYLRDTTLEDDLCQPSGPHTAGAFAGYREFGQKPTDRPTLVLAVARASSFCYIKPLRTKKYSSSSRKECGTAEELSGIEVDYTSLKLGSRSAFWSNVSVRVHPARAPSSAISASANDPRLCFSATMAVKTSCSFSIARTSNCRRRSTAVAIS
jgi:hypothetical protein